MSVLGDTQNLTGHSPEYPTLADLALSSGVGLGDL